MEQNRKIRLAAFDIDRTLVPPEIGDLAPETVHALHLLQQQGIKTVIASGRQQYFLQPELLELGFDYYILSNGAGIADRDGNMLQQTTMDPELLDRFLAEMIRRGYPVDLRYSRGMASGNPNCNTREFMQPFWEKMKFAKKPPKAFLEEIIPQPGERVISCSGCIPPEALTELEAAFPELDFLPVFESPMCDINTAGISKAYGLEKLCAMLGIDMAETIAFGDDRNDLEMIRDAGIGVAMGNAIQPLKEVADYITDTSAGLGVVKALQHFKLIP